MMQERMTTVETGLKTILEKLEILEGRESRRGAILDRMIDEELQRDEMYRHIKKHVLGTGIVAMVSMMCAILWYAVTSFLAK
jgi:hypothetical protein